MKITINLTDAEAKALAYVAVDPIEWVNNVVHDRCRIAIEQIFAEEVARMVADPNTTEIPADQESVVLAANIVSAADRINTI
jgi:hypothetical protein